MTWNSCHGLQRLPKGSKERRVPLPHPILAPAPVEDASQPALALPAARWQRPDQSRGTVADVLVHGFELAAINRNACFRKQNHPPAQLYEPRTNLLDGATVVLAEVRNRLVVRRHPTKQPHHLDVAPRFAFQPPARLHPVETAIDVC